MKLFLQKNAKFSSAEGSATRPLCLRRLGALPPNPQPPAAGGFVSRPPLASGGRWLRPQTPHTAPHCEFLATRLARLSQIECHINTFDAILRKTAFSFIQRCQSSSNNLINSLTTPGCFYEYRIFMSITSNCSLLLHNFQLPFCHACWPLFVLIHFFLCVYVLVVYFGPSFMLFMLAACVWNKQVIIIIP